MPYEPISGGTVEQSVLNSTLTCDELRNSLQDCATECYNKSLSDSGCPGFYTDTTQSNTCYICHVSNITEVQDSMYKTFGNNDKLYLLKSKPVTPDVWMSFDSHTGNTVSGIGIIGFIPFP